MKRKIFYYILSKNMIKENKKKDKKKKIKNKYKISPYLLFIYKKNKLINKEYL